MQWQLRTDTFRGDGTASQCLANHGNVCDDKQDNADSTSDIVSNWTQQVKGLFSLRLKLPIALKDLLASVFASGSSLKSPSETWHHQCSNNFEA